MQTSEQNDCTFMQWFFFSSLCTVETFLSYTHRCINPPPCILICSICCKLHYPCSQHRFLCTTIITELLDVSAALSEYLLWILGASSPKEEISIFLDFISSASLDPIFSNSYTFSPHSCFFQSIFIIFLSLSSIPHPQSFPAEHWCMRRQGSTQSPIQSSSTSPTRISQSSTWDGWWGRGSALGVGGYVMCCHWSLLDSRDIKDAWLLQGQDITITLSLSFFFYRCICSFWLLCSCRSARMLLIWYNIRLTQCKTSFS